MAALPSNAPLSAAGDGPPGQPQFRYPAVLALMITAVVFSIAAPSGNWSRAVGIAIEASALVITVATSRERESVRLRRAGVLAAAVLAAVILIGLGDVPRWLLFAAAIVVTAAIPAALIQGLLRLLRREGVTLNAVAGSLAIYLSTGLIFAWIVAFVAEVSGTPYFAQHVADTQGDKVYYSFTVLTTTGFGDFTPVTAVGHSVAVIEMLVGQLYLVTVIGLLIGNFASRRRT